MLYKPNLTIILTITSRPVSKVGQSTGHCSISYIINITNHCHMPHSTHLLYIIHITFNLYLTQLHKFTSDKLGELVNFPVHKVVFTI